MTPVVATRAGVAAATKLRMESQRSVTRGVYGAPIRGRLPMLENLIAVAMFVVLGIAVFTIGGIDQTV